MSEWVVRKEIEIEAPPDRVWPYVGTAEGLKRWTCPPAEVHECLLEQRVGGRCEQRVVVSGREWRWRGEVRAYDPPRTLSYTCSVLRADGSWSRPTTVMIALVDEGGRTRIIVEESGFEQADAAFRSTGHGWTAAVEELLEILVREALPPLGRFAVVDRIEVGAPIERVWWHVATQEGNRARHRAESTPDHAYDDELLEERVGGRYELRGLSYGEPFHIMGKILAYEPPRLLVMSWREDGWPADTVVTFRLAAYFGKTRITVIHSGFENLPADYRDRAMREYQKGRSRGMETLRRLLSARGAEVSV